jgi:hypothetical protein
MFPQGSSLNHRRAVHSFLWWSPSLSEYKKRPSLETASRTRTTTGSLGNSFLRDAETLRIPRLGHKGRGPQNLSDLFHLWKVSRKNYKFLPLHQSKEEVKKDQNGDGNPSVPILVPESLTGGSTNSLKEQATFVTGVCITDVVRSLHDRIALSRTLTLDGDSKGFFITP